jgi:uncharacterized repeat protein (TIGR03837 family)
MTASSSRYFHWQVFCRVIDNHGDLGVCWRLAQQLAQAGHAVTLWVDDGSALAWMAPEGASGVTVRQWPVTIHDAQWPQTHTVLIEAFGCALPECVHQRVAQHRAPLVWLNLEYLSAEPFVERNHGLASPVSQGPAAGRNKWFFYPGFTPGTGGLLRDTSGGASATLDALGLGERTEVSVFSYDSPALGSLVRHFQGLGLRVWCLAGKAAEAARAQACTPHTLPYLTQADFDELLQRCAFNVVRGEDSLTRALWAARPFIWHIYPQADGAHIAKLNAFLDRFDAPDCVRHAHWIWNGVAPAPLDGDCGHAWLPTAETDNWQQWTQWAQQAKESLQNQADLVSQLQCWALAHA